jgi:hypothetical protein
MFGGSGFLLASVFRAGAMYPSPAFCPRAPECVEEKFHRLRQSEVRAIARCAYTPFAIIRSTKGSTQDGQ